MLMPHDLARIIIDPAAYADGSVHDAFTRLRREAPFAKECLEGIPPFWAVTRHADIQEVERNSQDFSSGDLAVTFASGKNGPITDIGVPMPRSLVSMDGAEHRAFRQLTQGWFMPQNLRKLEDRIRQLARNSVDRMAALGGMCDFARDIALHYPLRVIMEILGVAAIDEPLMLRLTQELFGGEDEDLNRSGTALSGDEAVAATRQTVMEFIQFFSTMIADRKANPTEDLGSLVANGTVMGKPVGFSEAVGYYLITATAGHDTTSHTVSTGLWALAERPELLERLKRDPSLIQGHVDESIRWATAVRHFMRCATRDVEIAGQTIAKGDWIMLCYLSGARDETVFADPFEYDVTRSANRQISFGYGPHVCIGQHLARMEMRIFWEELIPRLQTVELAGTPALMATTFVGGPKTLPVRYQMA